LLLGQVVIGKKPERPIDRYTHNYYVDRTFSTEQRNENDKKDCVVISFDDFLANISDLRVTLISGSAGTGKTTTMFYIAETLKAKNVLYWISFIQLKDYCEQLKMTKTEYIPFFWQFFLKANCESNEFERKLFMHLFKIGKVFLFLDGLDELNEDLQELVLTQVKNWHDFFKSNQVILTVRDDLKYRMTVKKSLNIAAYNILPMSEEQQIKLLVNFEKNGKKSIDRKTAEKAVQMLSITKGMDNIVANTLQVRILAESDENDFSNINPQEYAAWLLQKYSSRQDQKNIQK
jgi:DNA polymerase III delta prime subunit